MTTTHQTHLPSQHGHLVHDTFGDGTGAIGPLLAAFRAANALRAKPASVRRHQAMLRRFLRTQEILTPAGITAAAVQDYLTDLAAGGASPKTIRNHAATVSHWAGWLAARGVLPGNPCSGVILPRLIERTPVWLRPDEAEQTLAIAAEAGVGCEATVAMHTGLRMGELRRLRWENVDLARRHLTVPAAESKSGRTRTVPLNCPALEALTAQERLYGRLPHVFPGAAYSRGGWTAARPRGRNWWLHALDPVRARVQRFNELPPGSTGRAWHLLRHTFGSRCAQQGISIYKISKWLGHKSVQTTMIYAHLAEQFDSDIERIV